MKHVILLITALCLCCGSLPAQHPKVGLVLGGGGAKGAAHVGVLRVLEQAGIRPDYIAGTSIGAIVGGLYAAGYTPNELDSLFHQQQWLSLLTDRKQSLAQQPYSNENGIIYIFGFPILDTHHRDIGFLRGDSIQALLDSMLLQRHVSTFDQLSIPFRCVAAQLTTAKEIELYEGSVARALRASMAIPGIFRPAQATDSLFLVDGGMINNLPVDVARHMGAEIVIAVDLQQNEPHLRDSTTQSPLLSVAQLLGIGPIAKWALTRPDIRRYLSNRQQADILIRPALPDKDATSFSRASIHQMVMAGEEAAKAQKEKWAPLMKK